MSKGRGGMLLMDTRMTTATGMGTGRAIMRVMGLKLELRMPRSTSRWILGSRANTISNTNSHTRREFPTSQLPTIQRQDESRPTLEIIRFSSLIYYYLCTSLPTFLVHRLLP